MNFRAQHEPLTMSMMLVLVLLIVSPTLTMPMMLVLVPLIVSP